MQTILVVIDTPEGGAVAARHVARDLSGATLHLLAVEPPIRSYAGRFLSLQTIRDHQRAAAAERLAEARRVLDEENIHYTVHVLVGEDAPTAAELARRIGADEIVMGDGSVGWFARFLFRILVARVIRLANIPVLVVKEPMRAASGASGRWGFAFSR